jgi:hypothetical protein
LPVVAVAQVVGLVVQVVQLPQQQVMLAVTVKAKVVLAARQLLEVPAEYQTELKQAQALMVYWG